MNIAPKQDTTDKNNSNFHNQWHPPAESDKTLQQISNENLPPVQLSPGPFEDGCALTVT